MEVYKEQDNYKSINVNLGRLINATRPTSKLLEHKPVHLARDYSRPVTKTFTHYAIVLAIVLRKLLQL